LSSGSFDALNQHHPPSVEDWLKGIGLESYLAQFLDNGYDTLDVCASLEEEDFTLDGLNISKKGHKKKIMMEAKKLIKPHAIPTDYTSIGRSSVFTSHMRHAKEFSAPPTVAAASHEKQPKSIKKKKRFVILSKNSQSSSSPTASFVQKKSEEYSPNGSANTSAFKKDVQIASAFSNNTIDDVTSKSKPPLDNEKKHKFQHKTDVEKYAPIYDVSKRKSPQEMERIIEEHEIGDLDAQEERPVTQPLRTTSAFSPRSELKTGRSLFRMSRLTASQPLNVRNLHLTPDEDSNGGESAHAASHSESHNQKGSGWPPQTGHSPIMKPSVIDLCDTPARREVIDDDNSSIDRDDAPLRMDTPQHANILVDSTEDSLIFEHLSGTTPFTKRSSSQSNKVGLENETSSTNIFAADENQPRDEVRESIEEDSFHVSGRRCHEGAESRFTDAPSPDSCAAQQQSDENQQIDEIQRNYLSACEEEVTKFKMTVLRLYQELEGKIEDHTHLRDDEIDDIVMIHDTPTFELPMLRQLMDAKTPLDTKSNFAGGTPLSEQVAPRKDGNLHTNPFYTPLARTSSTRINNLSPRLNGTPPPISPFTPFAPTPTAAKATQTSVTSGIVTTKSKRSPRKPLLDFLKDNPFFHANGAKKSDLSLL